MKKIIIILSLLFIPNYTLINAEAQPKPPEFFDPNLARCISDYSQLPVAVISDDGVKELLGEEAWNEFFDSEDINNATSYIFGEEASNIQAIDCQNMNIKNIEGISDMDRLLKVNLSGNDITDASELLNLEHLKILIIDDNPIENYEAIEHLVSENEYAAVTTKAENVTPVVTNEKLEDDSKIELSNILITAVTTAILFSICILVIVKKKKAK